MRGLPPALPWGIFGYFQGKKNHKALLFVLARALPPWGDGAELSPGVPEPAPLGLALPNARLGSNPSNNGAGGGLGSCLQPSCCRGGEELAPGQFIRKEGPALRIFSQEPHLLLRFVKPGRGAALARGRRNGTGNPHMGGTRPYPPWDGQPPAGWELPGAGLQGVQNARLWMPLGGWGDPCCSPSPLPSLSSSCGASGAQQEVVLKIQGGQRLLHHQIGFQVHHHVLQGQGARQGPSPCPCIHLFRLRPFSSAQAPRAPLGRGHHG